MTLSFHTERVAIIATCRAMNASGLNQGTSGNVSQRVDGGFLITPSGIAYADMRPEQIVFMDLEQGYWGDVLPSSEWRMHSDIYAAHATAGAVVHVHSTYATSLACLQRTIPAFHYMIAVAGGEDIRCADYATFGTRALSEAMLTALVDRKACLLSHHGQIAFGPNLDKALWLAGEVEALAMQYWAALQVGEPTTLPTDEMDRILQKFQSYGKQMQDLTEGAPAAFEMPVRRS